MHPRLSILVETSTLAQSRCANNHRRRDGASTATFLTRTPCAVDRQVRLPILITGIAGVPGYNAFHYFRERFGSQVIGIRQSTMWPLKGEGIVPCDLEDEQAIARLWDEYRFGL